MSGQSDYWREAVMFAFEGIGRFDVIEGLSSLQLDEIGEALTVSAEQQSMAFGWDVASSNLSASREREKADLRKEVARERRKVTCRHCNGYGETTTQGPYHSSTSQCFKCRGEGRHEP